MKRQVDQHPHLRRIAYARDLLRDIRMRTFDDHEEVHPAYDQLSKLLEEIQRVAARKAHLVRKLRAAARKQRRRHCRMVDKQNARVLVVGPTETGPEVQARWEGGQGRLLDIGQSLPVVRPSRDPELSHCHADCDGYCDWESCPQLRDGEPKKSHRHCPLDRSIDDEA